jgi:16S rRNA (adenine1518-N6/adenine1519-N6)-dimethyltransferase
MRDARPRKSLGQHFLHDPAIIERILASIDPRAGEHFVEIGPGRGALTGPLLDHRIRLDVIELDRDLAAALPARFDDDQLSVHCADALKFDFHQLDDGPLRLVGNLPYNVSTPLLFHILASSALFTDIHVMLQKEVVQRMAAAPGGRDYGRLTVSLAARCRVERLFDIRPGAFTPPPKVDSSFARLIPDAERLAAIRDPATFDRVVAAAFGQRRKQLGNSLRDWFTGEQLLSLNIDPKRRAETLSLAEFQRLANSLAAPAPGTPC